MSLVQDLKAARALISAPGTWCINQVQKFTATGTAYCALGALNEVSTRSLIRAAAPLHNALNRRFLTGRLPKPVYSGGGCPPISWDRLFDHSCSPSSQSYLEVVAQFNNSTSQAEVLALFDEAIADEEAKAATPLFDFSPPVKAPEPVAVRERVLEPA